MAWAGALAGTNGVKISENVSLLEAASALMGSEIEMANKYNVKDLNGNPLFYVVEQTGCFARQLKQCFGDCAPWSVDILWTGNGGADKVMRMERPFTCSCLCFNRPTVTITDETSGATMGSITDPCNLCGADLAAHDANGERLFSANGSCCQWGLCFPMPCGPCAKVEYALQDAGGQQVGMLTKKVPGCCKFFFAPDVQNYEVTFDQAPVWENPTNKALMIGMAVFMDFRYFSNNPNDDDSNMPDFAGE